MKPINNCKCGKPAKLYSWVSTTEDVIATWWRVGCTDYSCEIDDTVYQTKEQAIEVWNTRHEED